MNDMEQPRDLRGRFAQTTHRTGLMQELDGLQHSPVETSWYFQARPGAYEDFLEESRTVEVPEAVLVKLRDAYEARGGHNREAGLPDYVNVSDARALARAVRLRAVTNGWEHADRAMQDCIVATEGGQPVSAAEMEARYGGSQGLHSAVMKPPAPEADSMERIAELLERNLQATERQNALMARQNDLLYHLRVLTDFHATGAQRGKLNGLYGRRDPASG